MAARPKKRASGRAADLGPDTPISNQAHERAEAPRKPLLQNPSEGVNPNANPTTEGYEKLTGFKRFSAQEAARAALIQAPDTSGLKDIGEASFGPPPAVRETVHGVDNRVQITNTSSYPWRVHSSLLITAADGSQWIGTGWFIGPRTLITAGHVVYIKGSGVPGRDGWVRRIMVMPGRNGTSLPYGTVTSASFRTVKGWADSGDENFDYGAIIIPSDLGNTVGRFGFGVYSDADLQNAVANISGYPGDKPTGTQWYDARRVASVGPRKVFYDIDTAGGQSGSAAYRIVGGQRFAVAVHAYGGAVTNSGTRIVTPVYNNLVAWNA